MLQVDSLCAYESSSSPLSNPRPVLEVPDVDITEEWMARGFEENRVFEEAFEELEGHSAVEMYHLEF